MAFGFGKKKGEDASPEKKTPFTDISSSASQKGSSGKKLDEMHSDVDTSGDDYQKHLEKLSSDLNISKQFDASKDKKASQAPEKKTEMTPSSNPSPVAPQNPVSANVASKAKPSPVASNSSMKKPNPADVTAKKEAGKKSFFSFAKTSPQKPVSATAQSAPASSSATQTSTSVPPKKGPVKTFPEVSLVKKPAEPVQEKVTFEDLVKAIKEYYLVNKKKGFTKEQIVLFLQLNNYPEDAIEKAIPSPKKTSSSSDAKK